MHKYIRIHSIHQIDIVLCDLKRCLLKAKIAWRAAHDEAEINMDDMAVGINEDIVIVPVLYLKQVLHNRVSC